MLHSNVREKSKQDRLPNRSRFDKNKGHPASVTRGNSALFGLVHHTQDNPASRVPSGPLLVCLACLRKGEHGVDDGPKVSRINQGANLDQFITVGFHHKPERAYAMRLRILKRGRGLTMVTSTPAGSITCQERCKVSPPTVSKTRSTS